MGLSSELIAYRERLLKASQSVLGAAQGLHAVEIWETGYADIKPYAIIDFVNDVSLALALQSKQRHDLRLALYKTLSAKTAGPPPADTVPRTPLPPEKARVVPFPGTAATSAPVAFEVFEAICQHMYDAVLDAGVTSPRQIADTLYRTLVVDYDKDLQADSFVRWTAGQNDLKGLAGAPPELYALYVEKFHATLSLLLGPALGERLRIHALAAAQALPAAALYPPNRLLREA